MNKTLKILFIIISFVSAAVSLCAAENGSSSADIQSTDKKSDSNWEKYIKPKHLLDITVEPGACVYIGRLRNTLESAGAYIASPVFDVYLSLFIIRYFGMQAMFSSGCVIHPNSKPIEGTMLYMAIEAFGEYEWKYVLLKGFAGIGFEHPTWLIQQYASGFMECGMTFAAKVTDYMAITTSCKYRMGFLHIVDIYPERFMSITITAGLTFMIGKL